MVHPLSPPLSYISVDSFFLSEQRVYHIHWKVQLDAGVDCGHRHGHCDDGLSRSRVSRGRQGPDGDSTTRLVRRPHERRRTRHRCPQLPRLPPPRHPDAFASLLDSLRDRGDRFGEASDPCADSAQQPYTLSGVVRPHRGLCEALADSLRAEIGDEALIQGLNITTDSFYASQGRTDPNFEVPF